MRFLCVFLLVGCAQYRLTYKTGDTADTADTGAPADTDTADSDTTWDTDVDTDTDETDTAVPTPTECARILVYSTAADRRESGRFDGLPDEPGLARWQVDVRERAADGALTAAILEDYSQLWIMGTGRDIGGALEFDEVRAIRDFVEIGGGVLVAAEHETAEESYADDVALVSELYGVTFEGSRVEATDGAAVRVTDADATLLGGVSELPGFGTVAELVATDTNVAIAGSTAGAPALAWRTDGPRVAFDRSWEGWTDDWRTVGDQARLIANVADALEWCEE